jgi:ferritin-like metal-binding protein YciE
MAISTPKETFVALLSDFWNGTERAAKIYEELGQAARDPAIKEALDTREFIPQILCRLDECFRLIGQKPMLVSGRLHSVLGEDFRRGCLEIQTPLARRIFTLAKASQLIHLSVGECEALIAAADLTAHPAVGALLERCLADELALAEGIRRLMRAQLRQKLAA